MNQDQLEMLDALLNLEDGLTPWELNFVEQLSHRRDRELSDYQSVKLREIFEQRVSA